MLLSESIKENGLLVPVTVRNTEYGYQVISGERRIKACIMAGINKIPCVVSDFKGDPRLFRAAECLLGHQQDPLKEADRLKELCGEFSRDKVACLLSFTTGEISKLIEITALSSKTKEKAKEYHLSLYQLMELCQNPEAAVIPQREIKKAETVSGDKEKRLPPIKDARFLINSVKQLTESLCSAGVPIRYKQRENEREVEIKIKIEKNSLSPQMSLF